MSSDRFNYILIKIPENIDHKMIDDLIAKSEEISLSEAKSINEVLDLDPKETLNEALREDDLFEIAEEDLIVKKAVQSFLKEAIRKIILPRMYHEKRPESIAPIYEFSYIKIEDSWYAIAGQNVSYYSQNLNDGYKYVLAISYSNILDEYTK